jgi:hypothetical protein
MVFFILGALLIISNNNLALYNHSNVKIFLNFYSNWLDDVYSNSLGLTGNIIELDWLPKK